MGNQNGGLLLIDPLPENPTFAQIRITRKIRENQRQSLVYFSSHIDQKYHYEVGKIYSENRALQMLNLIRVDAAQYGVKYNPETVSFLPCSTRSKKS